MELAVLLCLLGVGALAGVLGALFGIGGGVVFIPVLTLLCGLSATEAAAVSLIGILATSAAGSAFYVREGVSNIRLGLLLEVSTVVGSMAGAISAAYLDEGLIVAVFVCVLLLSAWRMASGGGSDAGASGTGFAYNDLKEGRRVEYGVEHLASGFALCSAAGAVSSLTGVGGGLVKVPVMSSHMKVPIKAAAATSSYMIGVTAFSGSIVYLLDGTVILDVAAFMAIGAFLGSVVGTRISGMVDGASMKRYFSVLLVAVAAAMLLRLGGAA